MPNMAKLICSTKLVVYNISEATSPVFFLHASSSKRQVSIHMTSNATRVYYSRLSLASVYSINYKGNFPYLKNDVIFVHQKKHMPEVQILL
jgi:hypothetical protein